MSVNLSIPRCCHAVQLKTPLFQQGCFLSHVCKIDLSTFYHEGFVATNQHGQNKCNQCPQRQYQIKSGFLGGSRKPHLGTH